ncbi:MAG: LemA family protein [Gammaproteobacteria bacterium]|nr:MAG: LemA family protein [Gammaproteobacteria bacterium]RLA13850.1 MAG: LemA family protein [Gammaproteobacteria bacterium]RLA17490.1 MAG: LemA family protein [Gammaproteobacteria bacterium]
MSSSLITLIVLIAVAIWLVSIYNRLVSLRNRFKNAFAQIDVQLKRRYELIPNLVETAKAYLKHESITLEAVIVARQGAVTANDRAAMDPANPAAIQALITAETALTGTLGKLFALQENYPDLKADGTIQQLMEELTSTDNRVAFARQAYNDSVMEYNTSREMFPNNFIAGPFKFLPATSFEIDIAAEREAPKVSF